MKICIISTVAPRQMSMYSIYTDYFKNKNIEYDLIYLDRFSSTDVVEAKQVFRFNLKNANRRFFRYVSYLVFPFFCERIVKKEKYDFLIIWNELTAALLSHLLKKYKGNCIVNVRDLFDENSKLSYSILYKKLSKSIHNSLLTTVSSMRYVDFLPNNKEYVFFHSWNKKLNIHISNNNELKLPIKIMYIGNIRFITILEKFIHLIANDKRIEFILAGSGSDQLKEFCNKNKIFNVCFVGAFENAKTNEIVNQADVIYNLYGTDNNCLKTAISQKLYLAVALHKPILVFEQTYMYDLANKCGLAFGIKSDVFDKKTIDDFCEWFLQLNIASIEEKCANFVKEIELTNESFLGLLDETFGNGDENEN